MDGWLFPGIDYRHVVLTVPEQLRAYFETSPRLLSELVKAGMETLKVVMSRAVGRELQIGVVAVVQTAGRASNYNPHLHLMVTGGGIDEAGKWQEVKPVSYDFLHREWQWARVSAVEFIRRLVQHILPKGFQRVRYAGLHAVCLRQKIAERVRQAIGAALQNVLVLVMGGSLSSSHSGRI